MGAATMVKEKLTKIVKDGFPKQDWSDSEEKIEDGSVLLTFVKEGRRHAARY